MESEKIWTLVCYSWHSFRGTSSWYFPFQGLLSIEKAPISVVTWISVITFCNTAIAKVAKSPEVDMVESVENTKRPFL